MLQDFKSPCYLPLIQWSKKGKNAFSILLDSLQIIDIFSLQTKIKDKIFISINLLKLLSQDFKSLEYLFNTDIELASVSFKTKKSKEKHSVPPNSIILMLYIFFLNHVLLVLKNILHT